MSGLHKFSIIAAILLLVPLVCNMIMLTPICHYIVVYHGNSAWLTFLGSYSGSAITALFSYYILYQNMLAFQHQQENTERQRQLDRHFDEYQNIQKDLAERCANMPKTLVVDIEAIASDDPSKRFPQSVGELQSIYNQYRNLSGSARVLYSQEPDDECREFYRLYNGFMEDMIGLIADYIKFLTKHPNAKDSNRDSLMDYASRFEEMDRRRAGVEQAIINYLKSLCVQYKQEQNILDLQITKPIS